MSHTYIIVTWAVWLLIIKSSANEANSENVNETLEHLEQRLEKHLNLAVLFQKSIKYLKSRCKEMRRLLNDVNDLSRVTSFELNNVPRFCVGAEDKLFVLETFSKAIGVEFQEKNVLEMKHFFKRDYNNLNLRPSLNYIIKMKSVIQKESWMSHFKKYAAQFGWPDLYQFPGVSVPYTNESLKTTVARWKFLKERYSLVNVTMRDHISPFKMVLMAVLRGKIKPKRHRFRVLIRRNRLVIEHILPINKNIPEYIDDFSDIHKVDHMFQ